MREILFRGKRLDNGEWITASSIIFGEDGTVLIFSKAADIGDGNWDCQFERVDPLTVGQFTGLTDKNGKKIFEGDIVTFGNACRWTVVFKDFSWQAVVDECFHRFEKADASRVEVIGNIHDKEVPQ